MIVLVPLVISALLQSVAADTTIHVRAGTRLNVNVAVGSVVVRVWDRQDVRLLVGSPNVKLVIDTTPGTLNVGARVRGRGADFVRYEITVPRAMNLKLGRGDVDVDVSGTVGEVEATVRKGSVTIDGGRGLITAQTALGVISIANARGRISARTLDSDIRITDSAGDIQVEGSDGDVVLERIDAERVDASTVDGRIIYEGTLKPNGHYALASHDQGVRMSIPANSSATITVATHAGRTRSDFAFASRKEIDKGRFSFVVGAGAAEVSLSSFEGLVEVRRLPGAKR